MSKSLQAKGMSFLQRRMGNIQASQALDLAQNNYVLITFNARGSIKILATGRKSSATAT